MAKAVPVCRGCKTTCRSCVTICRECGHNMGRSRCRFLSLVRNIAKWIVRCGRCRTEHEFFIKFPRR